MAANNLTDFCRYLIEVTADESEWAAFLASPWTHATSWAQRNDATISEDDVGAILRGNKAEIDGKLAACSAGGEVLRAVIKPNIRVV